MNRFLVIAAVLLTAGSASASNAGGIPACERQVAQLQQQLAQLRSQNVWLLSQNAAAQQQITQLTDQLSSAEQQDTADEAQLSQLSAALASDSQEISSLTAHVSALQSEAAATQAQLAQAQDQVAAAQQALATGNANLTSCQASLPVTADISACDTIISQSGTYTVTADLNCGGDTAVNIEASNVTIFLNGHTIASSARSFAFGGSATVTGDAVFGPGTVTGSANSSVDIINASSSVVADVTFSGNRVGLATFGPASARHNLVVGNTFTNNSNGIQVLGGADSEFAHNFVTGSDEGIDVGGYVEYGQVTSGNSVHDNVCQSNNIGIHDMAGGTNDNFSSNLSQQNGAWDLLDEHADCGTDTWSNDTYSTGYPSDCAQ